MFLRPQYLIRVDDICPTMRWDLWRAIEDVLISEGITPILAVIPDNQDKTLHQFPAKTGFWNDVREWQFRGWTIGLHGYQHLYVSESSGIVGLNRYSEFAGLSFDEQSAKLKAALALFEREQVRADVWVAPAHTFDHETVRALCQLGLRILSDGHHLFPYRDGQGMMWVPQQLGAFRFVPFGLWTVCVHLDDPLYADVTLFRKNIQKFRKFITSLPEVERRYSYGKSSVANQGTASLVRWLKRRKVSRVALERGQV